MKEQDERQLLHAQERVQGSFISLSLAFKTWEFTLFYSDKLAAKHNCLLLLSGSLVSQITHVKTANNADK